jgi:hypothetical protein
MTLNGPMKLPAMAALCAFALMLAAPVTIKAQAAGSGSYVPSFAKLPDSAIAQFKSNPQGLLTVYASAGLPLSTEVRSLVLTDSSLVATLLTVAKGANDAQRAAMGAGLAEAARILVATNPQLAAEIQLAVAQSDLGPLITAFIAGSNATQNVSTDGAGGGAGGGEGGGSGGPTGGVGNSGGSNSGPNPGGVSFGSVNGASSFGGLGGGFAPGGGLTSSTSQSTSPSKSAI